ncbi:MAG: hypothetical protein LBG68_00890 [Coriobacteriales bacterium]|jgi:hypothetical protein|nr:hypothetical protein [Coriobacteriales bacterium]
MGLIRDFTDACREEIIHELIKADNQLEGWTIFEALYNWVYIASVRCELDESILEFYRETSDKYKEMAGSVGQIFDDVYAVESNTSSNLNQLLELSLGLSESLKALAAIIDPTPPGGAGPMLALSSSDFSDVLGSVNTRLLEATRARFVSIGEDGSLIYDWDLIDEVLGKDADKISEAEYYVLAELYTYMGLADTEKFIQALAEKVTDRTDGLVEFTEWAYDPEKVNRLISYVNAFAYVASIYEYSFDLLTDDQVAELYAAWFPNGGYTETSDQRNTLRESSKDEWYRIVQQSSFLSVARELAFLPGGSEQIMSDDSLFSEMGGLTGAKGAFGPNITIVEVKYPSGEIDSYILTYTNTQSVSSVTPTGPTSVYNTISRNHFNENQVTINAPQTSLGIGDTIDDAASKYFAAKYSSSYPEVSGEVSNAIAYSVIEGFFTSILETTLERSTYTVGPPIAVLGAVKDAIIEENRKAEVIREVNSLIAVQRLGDYCVTLDMPAVIYDDGSGNLGVLMYPNPMTYHKVEGINHIVEKYGIDTSLFGFVSEITLNDILNNPGAVYELLTDTAHGGFTEDQLDELDKY